MVVERVEGSRGGGGVGEVGGVAALAQIKRLRQQTCRLRALNVALIAPAKRVNTHTTYE